MKTVKLAGVLSGAVMAVTSLLGGVASAATGSVLLSGATQTNGSFATSINVSATDTINYAEVHLTLSGAAQGASIDFTGSNFVQQTASCSGTSCVAAGYIAGGSAAITSGKLATLRFSVANPGSVTVSVDSSSYFAHPNPPSAATSVAASGTPAAYTYNAPAQGGMGSGSGSSTGNTGTTTTTTSGRNAAANSTSANNATATAATPPATDDKNAKADVKADSTKAANDNKKEMVQNTAAKKHNVWPWIVLVVVAAAAVAYAMRNRTTKPAAKDTDVKVVKPADADKTKAAATAVVATAATGAKKAGTPNKKKNANTKNSGKKNR